MKTNNKVKLVASDGVEIEVEEEIAMKSTLIKNLIDG
jgi:hypothetical protein